MNCDGRSQTVTTQGGNPLAPVTKTKRGKRKETVGSVANVKRKSFDLIKIIRYIKFNWIVILIALAVAITESIVTSKIPDATANLFDGNFEMAKLWKVIGNSAIALGLYSLTQILMLYAQAAASRSARKSVWNRLMNLRMDFYDDNNPASLLNTVTADAEIIGTGLVTMLVQIPAIAVLLWQCMQIVAGYNIQLLYLIGTIVLIHLLYMVIAGNWQKKIATDAQIQAGLFTGFLAGRIRNMDMIKSFGTQQQEYGNGVEESKKVFKIGKRAVKLTAFTSTYQAFIYLLGTVISVIWGCALIRSGAITTPQFIGVFTYIAIINVMMILVSVYWNLIKDFSGRAYRIARLCEAPQETAKNKCNIETDDGKVQLFKFIQKSKQCEKSKVLIKINVIGFSAQRGLLSGIKSRMDEFAKSDSNIELRIKENKLGIYFKLIFRGTQNYDECTAKLSASLANSAENKDDVVSIIIRLLKNADKAYGISDIEMDDVKLNNVDFAYNNGENILSNVSFTIPKGKITALVGPSGSGKTTVIKLLESLYSPLAGTITVGQNNLADFNTNAWRRKLAYVIQDAGIFSGTIRDCLTYGVEREVSDEELEKIIKLTGLDGYIHASPYGFNTPVASWGTSLSGGQRQRIVISRALLRNADFLIFDEPTSALDPETANQISKLIFESFKGKTVLVISHELNFISKADNIVFLNDGIVEGEGNHDHIMETCPVYKELVTEQSYKEVFGA